MTTKSRIALIIIVCVILATGYILYQKTSISDSKNVLVITQTGSPRERNLETTISIEDENGNVHIIAQVPQENVRDIKLSSDGQYVAYTFLEFPSTNKDIQYVQKIRIMPTSGQGQVKELTDVNAGLRENSKVNYYKLVGWAPNDKKLYAVKVNDIQGGWQDKGLYAIDINTREITGKESSEEILVGATLSPDGRQLAYIPYISTSGRDLWLAFKPETIKVLDITSGRKIDIGLSYDAIDFNSLKWSLDNKSISYKLNGSPSILEVKIEK